MYILNNLLDRLKIKLETVELCALQLGILLMNDETIHHLRFHEFHNKISEANARNKIAIVFDRLGVYLGNIIWDVHTADNPKLDTEATKKVVSTGNINCIEIKAVSVTPGNFYDLFRFMRQSIFPPEIVVSYLRRQYKNRTFRRKTIKSRTEKPIPKKINDAIPFFLTSEGADIKHTISLFMEEALSVGKATILIEENSVVSDQSVADMVNRVHNPLLLEQARLFYDMKNKVVGFLSWAWIEESELESIIFPSKRTIDQWNYGEFLHICDAIARPGHENLLVEFLRQHLYVEEEKAVDSVLRHRNLKTLSFQDAVPTPSSFQS